MKLKENLNGPLLLVIILILTGAVIAGTILISFKTQYKNTAPYKTSIELRANSKELAIKEITNDTVIKLTVSKLKEEENVTEDKTDTNVEDNNVVE